MKKDLVLAALTFAAGMASWMAAAQPQPSLPGGAPPSARLTPPTIADFVLDADIRDVRLSPSGEQILIFRLGSNGRYLGEIRGTADLGQGGFSFDAAPAEIRGGSWLSDQRILVHLRERRVVGRKTRWFDFLSVFDEKGVLKFRLPSDDASVIGRGSDGSESIFLSYDSDGDGSPDVHKFWYQSGRAERIVRGSDRRFGFIADRDGDVRISSTFDPSTFELTYHGRDKNGADWKPIHVYSLKSRATWVPLGFHTDNRDELLVLANNGHDKAGIHVFSMSNQKIVKTMVQRDDVDMIDVVTSRTGRLLGARYNVEAHAVDWLDPAQKQSAEAISKVLPGKSFNVSEASALSTRIIRTDGATDAGVYYLQRQDGRIQLLGSAQPQFDGKALATRTLTTIAARDGMNLQVYLTRPVNPTAGKSALVVLPHGGPWARDFGGFDPWAQFLAAQGYLVAQPQFRGSAGFGQALNRAGDAQWGQAMQDDLDDITKALVKSGQADATRVAMFGWSYGGYAALTAGFRGNGLYRCAIAGAAVSDLSAIVSLLSDNPIANLIQRPTIKGPSPVDELKNATIPIFIVHGDEDSIVDVDQGRAAAGALRAAGKPHVYVEIKGMDHTSDRFTAAHRQQFYGLLHKWLKADCGL